MRLEWPLCWDRAAEWPSTLCATIKLQKVSLEMLPRSPTRHTIIYVNRWGELNNELIDHLMGSVTYRNVNRDNQVCICKLRMQKRWVWPRHSWSHKSNCKVSHLCVILMLNHRFTAIFGSWIEERGVPRALYYPGGEISWRLLPLAWKSH